MTIQQLQYVLEIRKTGSAAEAIWLRLFCVGEMSKKQFICDIVSKKYDCIASINHAVWDCAAAFLLFTYP